MGEHKLAAGGRSEKKRKTWTPDDVVMPYDDEKAAGRNCANFECPFWDDLGDYELRCSAGGDNDDPYIEECQKYIPEYGGA